MKRFGLNRSLPLAQLLLHEGTPDEPSFQLLFHRCTKCLKLRHVLVALRQQSSPHLDVLGTRSTITCYSGLRQCILENFECRGVGISSTVGLMLPQFGLRCVHGLVGRSGLLALFRYTADTLRFSLSATSGGRGPMRIRNHTAWKHPPPNSILSRERRRLKNENSHTCHPTRKNTCSPSELEGLGPSAPRQRPGRATGQNRTPSSQPNVADVTYLG